MRKLIPLTFSVLLSVSPLLADTAYDYQKKEFVNKSGGIDEVVLNHFSHEEPEIQYLTKIDEFERKMEFISIDSEPYETKFALELIGAIDQYDNMIEEIKKSSNEKLSDNKHKLKKLLESLDKFNSYSDGDKLKQIYCVLNDSLLNKENSLYIGDIVNSSDYMKSIPFYYAILNHYHIFVTFRVGTSKFENNKKAVHVWLWFRIDKKTFELDPYMYSNIFAPIEVRKAKQTEEWDTAI